MAAGSCLVVQNILLESGLQIFSRFYPRFAPNFERAFFHWPFRALSASCCAPQIETSRGNLNILLIIRTPPLTEHERDDDAA